MIKVREYDEHDLDSILDVEDASFKFPYSKEIFTELLRQKSTRMLVAEDIEGQIIGYILYSIKSGKCLLISIAVLPEYRRSGVGSMLMQTLLKEVYGNVRQVELQVGCKNFDAIKFYLKFNFKIVGVIPKYYSDGEDAYFMVKILD
ncbi:MAG: ribosomal protein S18-alanine N-acetyltransferase [Nitrososphaeria archaeon]